MIPMDLKDPLVRDIPSIEACTHEEFQQKWMTSGGPVILRGAFPDCAAKSWTHEYLKQKCSENIVHTRKNTHREDYKVGKKYNIEQLQFGTLIDLIVTENPKSSTYYLAATNLRTGFPQIHEEFHVPNYIEKIHHGPYLWVSARNHYEFCHVDSDDGMLFMIQGEKHVKLYSYNEFHKLYPNPLGSLGRTIQSQVNCSKPNLELFPDFGSVVCEVGVLRAGDMLFIPAFYWHQVTSVTPCISVNIFFGDGGESRFLEKLIQTRWDAFSYWFDNILEQNREGIAKLLENLPGTLRAFFLQQFKEVVTEEQLRILVTHVFKYLGVEEKLIFDETRKHPTRLKIRGLLWRG